MTTATAPATARGLITADDLLRLDSEGVRGELIRGVLSETMPSGREHGQIVVKLVLRLGNFVEPRKLGILTASDSGVWLERDPDTVREPDVAFFSAEKITPGERVTGYAEVAPDLVVEIVSPSDCLVAVNDKALMWLRYGVRIVWVVRPDERVVDVHRDGHPVAALAERATRSTARTFSRASLALSARFSARSAAFPASPLGASFPRKREPTGYALRAPRKARPTSRGKARGLAPADAAEERERRQRNRD